MNAILFQVGISLSYIIWALSSNLIIFIIARVLGGISKGNVSLSMAIITDVSSIQTRNKGMVRMILGVDHYYYYYFSIFFFMETGF